MRSFALTYPQLMNQALAQGLDHESLVCLRRAHDLATEIAGDRYRAQGVPQLCHLIRTASIVLAERQPLPVVLAALLHTADLRQRFDGGAGASERAALEPALAAEVAALVRRYATSPWYSPGALDEHLARVDGFEDAERHLLVMRLANELEDHLDGAMDFTPAARAQPRHAVHRQMIALAERLGLPRLADELREVTGAAAARALPPGIVLGHRQGYAGGRRDSGARRAARAGMAVLGRAREVACRDGARGVLRAVLERFGYQR
jgi:(p)ppGpp synthase/HD superfamily hydrolase